MILPATISSGISLWFVVWVWWHFEWVRNIPIASLCRAIASIMSQRPTYQLTSLYTPKNSESIHSQLPVNTLECMLNPKTRTIGQHKSRMTSYYKATENTKQPIDHYISSIKMLIKARSTKKNTTVTRKYDYNKSKTMWLVQHPLEIKLSSSKCSSNRKKVKASSV